MDNEYGESNNEYKVTYDEQGNRNVDREVGYYQYAIKNDKAQSIVYLSFRGFYPQSPFYLHFL